MQAILERTLSRVFCTVALVSPYGANVLRALLQSWLRHRARRFLDQSGVLRRIEEYTGKSESTGCSYEDYAVLYKQLRSIRPKEVLECGTGVSTIVMAQALVDNEREYGVVGRITSMEELSSYYSTAKNLIPADLAGVIDLVLSDTEEYSYGMFRGMRYGSVPSRNYDLIFVDGPNTASKRDGQTTFDADAVAIISQSEQQVSVIVDGRSATCAVLQMLFGKERFKYDYLRGIGILTASSRMHVRGSKQIGATHYSERRFAPNSAEVSLA